MKEANNATDPLQVEQLLEDAAALYGGNYLMEELYSEWAAPRRDALQRSWVGLLLTVVTFGIYYWFWYYLVNDELKDIGFRKVTTIPVLPPSTVILATK